MRRFVNKNGVSFFRPEKQIKEGVFTKRLEGTFYQRGAGARGIGMDSELLSHLREDWGVHTIVVTRKPESPIDSGAIFSTSIDTFIEHGVIEDRGEDGVQTFLMLENWTMQDYRQPKMAKTPKAERTVRVARVKTYQKSFIGRLFG